MTENMYEELIEKVIDTGDNAIEDLVGYLPNYNNNEELEEIINDILDQMPEDIALEFYNKYCK